jgi:hypothetical protein
MKNYIWPRWSFQFRAKQRRLEAKGTLWYDRNSFDAKLAKYAVLQSTVRKTDQGMDLSSLTIITTCNYTRFSHRAISLWVHHLVTYLMWCFVRYFKLVRKWDDFGTTPPAFAVSHRGSPSLSLIKSRERKREFSVQGTSVYATLMIRTKNSPVASRVRALITATASAAWIASRNNWFCAGVS